MANIQVTCFWKGFPTVETKERMIKEVKPQIMEQFNVREDKVIFVFDAEQTSLFITNLDTGICYSSIYDRSTI